MRFLLDTNVCVAHLRGNPTQLLAARLQAQPHDNICLCSVVRAELIYGALRSHDPIEGVRRVLHFIAPFVSFAFDDAAADCYGELRAFLSAAGTPIGPNDLLIAAIALTNKLTLVTTNLREFRRVPNLTCEDWTVP